jgi:hypothetical protein
MHNKEDIYGPQIRSSHYYQYDHLLYHGNSEFLLPTSLRLPPVLAILFLSGFQGTLQIKYPRAIDADFPYLGLVLFL